MSMQFVTPQQRAIALALASMFIGSPARAADTPTDLDKVVVTGTRHAQTVDDALAAVTLITRHDIDASPATDLISLLAQQAGVDVARTGGAGQSSMVFLRGANPNQTLVLVDGIRVAAASNGLFDFAHLPLAQIDRIEIVRGPRAAYWGADAIGGVIQIFTRKAHGFSGSVNAGSYAQRGGHLAFGTPGDDDAHLGVVASEDVQRGISATDRANPFGNPDADGYRNRSASVRGNLPLGTQTLAVSVLHTDGDGRFDGGPTSGPDPSRSFARTTAGGATLSGPVAGSWSQSLTVGGAGNAVETPIYGSRIVSHRTSVDWVNTVQAGADHLFTFGGNWQRESGTTFNAYSANPLGIDYARGTTNAAAFAGYDGHFGHQQVELAIRHDDNSQFGGATTGNVAWGWQLAPAWRVRAAWGSGFRAPSFDELYSPGYFGFYAGNPALRPERSDSVEGGLEFTPASGHRFALSAWHTRVRELIAFDGPNFGAINIARATLDGAELTYRFTHDRWHAGGAITWQDPRDADSGSPLLRRPPRKLAGEVRYDVGNGWDVAIDGLASAARADIGGPNGGYALLDFALGRSFHTGWRLQLRVNNLFDRRYELARGYRMPGRTAQVTLAWPASP